MSSHKYIENNKINIIISALITFIVGMILYIALGIHLYYTIYSAFNIEKIQINDLKKILLLKINEFKNFEKNNNLLNEKIKAFERNNLEQEKLLNNIKTQLEKNNKTINALRIKLICNDEIKKAR